MTILPSVRELFQTSSAIMCALITQGDHPDLASRRAPSLALRLWEDCRDTLRDIAPNHTTPDSVPARDDVVDVPNIDTYQVSSDRYPPARERSNHLC